MHNVIEIECPPELLIGLHTNAEQFAERVKREAAYGLFREGAISLNRGQTTFFFINLAILSRKLNMYIKYLVSAFILTLSCFIFNAQAVELKYKLQELQGVDAAYATEFNELAETSTLRSTLLDRKGAYQSNEEFQSAKATIQRIQERLTEQWEKELVLRTEIMDLKDKTGKIDWIFIPNGEASASDYGYAINNSSDCRTAGLSLMLIAVSPMNGSTGRKSLITAINSVAKACNEIRTTHWKIVSDQIKK
ncbi:MAG: hypothetical protein HZB64_02725 [Rhodocyclales bacterium]|nr:hypothetical protein [Rhodocyclales bacterium]